MVSVAVVLYPTSTLMWGIAHPIEAEGGFNALAENGTVTMPMSATFWVENLAWWWISLGTRG